MPPGRGQGRATTSSHTAGSQLRHRLIVANRSCPNLSRTKRPIQTVNPRGHHSSDVNPPPPRSCSDNPVALPYSTLAVRAPPFIEARGCVTAGGKRLACGSRDASSAGCSFSARLRPRTCRGVCRAGLPPASAGSGWRVSRPGWPSGSSSWARSRALSPPKRESAPATATYVGMVSRRISALGLPADRGHVPLAALSSVEASNSLCSWLTGVQVADR